MSLAKYETFLRVVELGGVTRAAEALGYTQSGVSHSLNALEEELGLVLLTRGRSGARLTDAGERLLPHIRAMLACHERLRQTAADLNGLSVGNVRVGVFTSVGVGWLPRILKEFSAEQPGIEFSLLNGDYHDIEGWLGERAVDVAFVTLPCDCGYELVPLKEDRLMVILPKGHPLAKLTEFPLEGLNHEPFISLLDSSAHDARRVTEKRGVKLNVKYVTKDDYALIAMVENGLGISVVPELLLRGQDERVRALPPETHDTRVIALAVSPDAPPAAQRFAAFVKAWTEKNA